VKRLVFFSSARISSARFHDRFRFDLKFPEVSADPIIRIFDQGLLNNAFNF
jgi:hypothetical protein